VAKGGLPHPPQGHDPARDANIPGGKRFVELFKDASGGGIHLKRGRVGVDAEPPKLLELLAATMHQFVQVLQICIVLH
jgi:hypothetical protein